MESKTLSRLDKLGGSIDNLVKSLETRSPFGLKQVINIEKVEANHIYINVILNNDSNTYKEAIFTQTFTNNIIEIPSDYFFSIIRFNIPTNSIPITIFIPNTREGNASLSVTLEYNGFPYNVPLVYVSQHANTHTPQYFIYSFQQFIDMINVAFDGATELLRIFNPSIVTTPPYITFDSNTNKFTLNVESRYLSNNANPITIYMGTALYSYFDNFNTIYYGYQTVTQRDFEFIIENTGNNYLPTVNPPTFFAGATGASSPVVIPFGAPGGVASYNGVTGPTGIPGYFFRQETSAEQNFYSFKSMAFKTGNIPVKAEYLPSAGASISNSNAPSSNFRNIITDFEPIVESNSPIRGFQQYFANPYRLIDLDGNNNNLRTIDLQAYWYDIYNNEYPFFIAPGQSLSMKMMFRHKNLGV